MLPYPHYKTFNDSFLPARARMRSFSRLSEFLSLDPILLSHLTFFSTSISSIVNWDLQNFFGHPRSNWKKHHVTEYIS